MRNRTKGNTRRTEVAKVEKPVVRPPRPVPVAPPPPPPTSPVSLGVPPGPVYDSGSVSVFGPVSVKKKVRKSAKKKGKGKTMAKKKASKQKEMGANRMTYSKPLGEKSSPRKAFKGKK